MEEENEVQWGLSQLISPQLILHNKWQSPGLRPTLFSQAGPLENILLVGFSITLLFHVSALSQGPPPPSSPNPWLPPSTPSHFSGLKSSVLSSGKIFLMWRGIRLPFHHSQDCICFYELWTEVFRSLIFIHLMDVCSGLECMFYDGRDWVCLALSPSLLYPR